MEAILTQLVEALAAGVMQAFLPWLSAELSAPKPVVIAEADPAVDQQAQNAVTAWEQNH